jgi:hypothetical protein
MKLLARLVVPLTVAACYAAVLLATARAAESVAENGAETPDAAGTPMKLWKTVDLSACPVSFPCLGDLNGDGKVDFLLYRQGPQTTPGYLVAVDHRGRKLWERGDASIDRHAPDGKYNEPALRGIALVYDLDSDGDSEVVTELWDDGKPMLCVLDGATGHVERRIASPLDPAVRGGERSRCHPLGRIAHLHGQDGPASIVLKYEASGNVPSHAVALSPSLEVQWHFRGHPDAIGHIPTVGDLDGDGCDEIALGRTLVDGSGEVLWQKKARRHADCTALVQLPGRAKRAVLISICGTGPAFCLSAEGKTIWAKTSEEVSHGQGVWAGNFIDEEPGPEVIVLCSGHVGDFLTVRAADGKPLAAFQHRTRYKAYPDFPCVVDWQGGNVQSLWVPIDRSLVDGRGRTVAHLGSHEKLAGEALQWGTTKDHLAVQAFAVDLCGDARDELVLYQPYNGEAILIFTQADSDGREKPYVAQPAAYNIRSYY